MGDVPKESRLAHHSGHSAKSSCAGSSRGFAVLFRNPATEKHGVWAQWPISAQHQTTWARSLEPRPALPTLDNKRSVKKAKSPSWASRLVETCRPARRARATCSAWGAIGFSLPQVEIEKSAVCHLEARSCVTLAGARCDLDPK